MSFITSNRKTSFIVFFFQSREVLRHFPDISFTDAPESYSTVLVDILLRGILP